MLYDGLTDGPEFRFICADDSFHVWVKEKMIENSDLVSISLYGALWILVTRPDDTYQFPGECFFQRNPDVFIRLIRFWDIYPINPGYGCPPSLPGWFRNTSFKL